MLLRPCNLYIDFLFSENTCVVPNNPKNGLAHGFALNLLQLKCNHGYFFNPKPNGAAGFNFVSYTCQTNKWAVWDGGTQTFVVLTFVPDCVGKNLTFELLIAFHGNTASNY